MNEFGSNSCLQNESCGPNQSLISFAAKLFEWKFCLGWVPENFRFFLDCRFRFGRFSRRGSEAGLPARVAEAGPLHLPADFRGASRKVRREGILFKLVITLKFLAPVNVQTNFNSDRVLRNPSTAKFSHSPLSFSVSPLKSERRENLVIFPN